MLNIIVVSNEILTTWFHKIINEKSGVNFKGVFSKPSGKRIVVPIFCFMS